MSDNSANIESGITSLGQIAIAVSDLEQAVIFYRDSLGSSLLFDVPPSMTFFDCEGICGSKRQW